MFEAGVNYLDRKRFHQAVDLLRIIAEQADLDNLSTNGDIDAAFDRLCTDDKVDYDRFRSVVNTKEMVPYLQLGKETKETKETQETKETENDDVVGGEDKKKEDDKTNEPLISFGGDVQNQQPTQEQDSDNNNNNAATKPLVDIDDLLS